MNIQITPSVVEHMGSYPEQYLRVRIKSGGCAGLRAIFSIEQGDLNGDDQRYVVNNVSVVTDALSVLFLEGCTIDYIKEMLSEQFVLIHPKAENACGCGESFSLS